ncbi:hypothetical protein [Sphaerisporangium rufum]|uniref:hypothetical protein n=1 Tax=Sphaerisporangium rufum TaxID=1381558 RepID=UPI00194FA088|nr:hypothetical protein [Sphaerisporangium rufum]
MTGPLAPDGHPVPEPESPATGPPVTPLVAWPTAGGTRRAARRSAWGTPAAPPA